MMSLRFIGCTQVSRGHIVERIHSAVLPVKQEILMSDVQTCFNTLKKAVHDLHSMAAASNAQLQMGQGTMR